MVDETSPIYLELQGTQLSVMWVAHSVDSGKYYCEFETLSRFAISKIQF
jgi:hypothetical protein